MNTARKLQKTTENQSSSQKAPQTRAEQITQCAAELIQSEGYNGFSYKDIADAIGIAKASIHHHFPTKGDLALSYCAMKEAQLQQLQTELNEVPDSTMRLHYFMSMLRMDGIARMDGITAMHSDYESLPADVQSAVDALVVQEFDIIKDILMKGQGAGDFTYTMPHRHMTLIVLSTMKNMRSYKTIAKAQMGQDDINDDRIFMDVCVALDKLLKS